MTSLEGPSGVSVVEVDDATAADGQVLVEVMALGLSWPDLLLTRGEYQLRPEVPFQLGVDIAGVVRSAPGGSGLSAGTRVACCLPLGGGADLVSVDPDVVLPLPENMTFEQGAAMPMNYLTAEFALATRGEVTPGSTVLVNGAAGGVGTASVQVARGLGARVIAVASTDEKALVATQAGAHHAVLADGFLTAVKELTDGNGVDVVLDVVGEPLFLDSLRSLAPLGRLLVVGFTGGEIPQVKVNRLLLNNIDVRGVAWGSYAMSRPGYMKKQWERLAPMIAEGTADPVIGKVLPVAHVADALTDMAERRVTGKSVVVFD